MSTANVFEVCLLSLRKEMPRFCFSMQQLPRIKKILLEDNKVLKNAITGGT